MQEQIRTTLQPHESHIIDNPGNRTTRRTEPEERESKRQHADIDKEHTYRYQHSPNSHKTSHDNDGTTFKSPHRTLVFARLQGAQQARGHRGPCWVESSSHKTKPPDIGEPAARQPCALWASSVGGSLSRAPHLWSRGSNVTSKVIIYRNPAVRFGSGPEASQHPPLVVALYTGKVIHLAGHSESDRVGCGSE